MLVQLIAHTNDPEKTIAAAAKLCYSDAHIETLLDGLTPEKTAAFLQKLTDLGHASPIEHASFTFGIEGVSRTFLAQVTRHRIGSFSVQSQRYVRLDDFRYVIPPEIEAIPEAKAQFIASMNEDAEKYLALVRTLEDAHTARFMAEGLTEKAARAKAADLQAQIDAATKERTALAATLPTDVLTDYERLLKQFRGLAVETIQGNIPTICHTALQASSMSDLNHDGSEIAHCPYCHRLLVLPSKEA